MFKVRIKDYKEKAEVYLYGTIGQDWWGEGNSAKEFAEKLSELSPKPLDVRIDSGGGDVYEAFAIASAIQRYEGDTTAYVDGIAASAASYVAAVCDRVVMSDYAYLMIHNAWCVVCGNAKELENVIARLEQIDATICDLLTKRSAMSREQVSSCMEAETWFGAKEALENGLCQEVIETEERMAACIPQELATKFRNTPEGVSIAVAESSAATADEGAASHAEHTIADSSKEAEGAANEGKTYRLLNGRLYERNSNGI